MFCMVYQELSFASDEPLWERVERRELKANNIRSDPWARSSPLGTENELQAGGRETFKSRGSDSFIGQEMWPLTPSLTYKHNVYVYAPSCGHWMGGEDSTGRKSSSFWQYTEKNSWLDLPLLSQGGRVTSSVLHVPKSSKDTITFNHIIHSKAMP